MECQRLHFCTALYCRLQLPAKLRNAALAQPDMELRIKAAVLPSAPQPPTAFQQPRDHWGFPLALDCGAQPCSPVGPVTQQCREEGRAAVRSADALLWQHCGETSSGCITPRAGRPPTTSVQGGSSAASPQASCSATLSDTLSQGTLPAASPRARSPPTAPTSPPPPCTDTQHGSDASPTPSSLGLTWAELGVSQPSSPTAGSGLETRLHRLASYLRGGPAERGTEPQPGGPSRLHSRLGDHSLSYASSPESASQLVLPGSHQASSMYTGAEKPPALPSPPWLEVNGGTACGSTSKQWLLGLEEGAEEGRG